MTESYDDSSRNHVNKELYYLVYLWVTRTFFAGTTIYNLGVEKGVNRETSFIVEPQQDQTDQVTEIADTQDGSIDESIIEIEITGLFSMEQLLELVGPIALYPDELIAIVIPTSTFPLDIVQAPDF